MNLKVLPSISSSAVSVSTAASTLCRKLNENKPDAKPNGHKRPVFENEDAEIAMQEIVGNVPTTTQTPVQAESERVTTLAELARLRKPSSPVFGNPLTPVVSVEEDAGYSVREILSSKPIEQKRGASLAGAVLGKILGKKQ